MVYERIKRNKFISAIFIIIAITVFLHLSCLNLKALSDEEYVDLILSDPEAYNILETAEEIRYSFNESENIIYIYSVKNLNNEYPYISDFIKARADETGRINIVPQQAPSQITIEGARALIAKRLWLFKTDIYDNTALLDYTKNPIKDANGIELYPLLDEFSTTEKFKKYLNTILTPNLAEHYLEDTTVTEFGNTLYDIGAKVAQYTFDYETFSLEELFTSENWKWRFYRITVPFDEFGDSVFTVGLFYGENGWRIAYSDIQAENELEYFNFYNYSSEINHKTNNPSTNDISYLIPILFFISSAGFCLIKKK